MSQSNPSLAFPPTVRLEELESYTSILRAHVYNTLFEDEIRQRESLRRRQREVIDDSSSVSREKPPDRLMTWILFPRGTTLGTRPTCARRRRRTSPSSFFSLLCRNREKKGNRQARFFLEKGSRLGFINLPLTDGHLFSLTFFASFSRRFASRSLSADRSIGSTVCSSWNPRSLSLSL